MLSLQETKHRIQSIKTTRKTTKAMELVASIKLRRAMKQLGRIQEYYTSVFNTFQHLFNSTKDLNKIFPTTKDAGTLYIIVTSNLGLCGAYNANVMRLFDKHFGKGDKVIVLGKKGAGNLRANNIPIFQEITELSEVPDYNNASVFGMETISRFMKGEVSKVKLIYTKFINSITFEANILQLMPIEPPQDLKISTNLVGPQAVTEFEPSPEVVIKESLKLYVSAIIYGAMIESKVSEVASRRTAMENATDNADDLIHDLTIKYNTARQSAITQEINEIISGSDV